MSTNMKSTNCSKSSRDDLSSTIRDHTILLFRCLRGFDSKGVDELLRVQLQTTVLQEGKINASDRLQLRLRRG